MFFNVQGQPAWDWLTSFAPPLGGCQLKADHDRDDQGIRGQIETIWAVAANLSHLTNAGQEDSRSRAQAAGAQRKNPCRSRGRLWAYSSLLTRGSVAVKKSE